MIFPNKQFPVQVSKFSRNIEDLKEVVEWIKHKKAIFIVAKTHHERPFYAVYRKFGEEDDSEFQKFTNLNNKKTKMKKNLGIVSKYPVDINIE